MRRSFALAVVLIILIVIPAYAQQAGLTLEQLAGRIDVLFAGQTYLTQRIAALETTVAISAQRQVNVVPTATPGPRPTQTLTPSATPTPESTETATTEPSATSTFTHTPSATPTPTPASARVTADRRLSLRRAPGNNHSIVAYVELNNQFDVIGRNLAGSWIQVDYNGKIGWLPARYADDVDIFPIVATPTPLPKPTVAPTRTPVPTATMATISPEDWEVIMELVKKDVVGMGKNPDLTSLDNLHSWTSQLAGKMRKALERCPDLTIVKLAEILDKNAQMVDDAGIAERLEAAIRWDLAEKLADRPEENRHSCRQFIIGRRRWIIAEYGEE